MRGVDGIANNVDPDQTAPRGSTHLKIFKVLSQNSCMVIDL